MPGARELLETPRHTPVQVVYEELKDLMGGQQAELVQPKYGPAVILMAGLQVKLLKLAETNLLTLCRRAAAEW